MHVYRTILQHGALAPQDYSHHATLAEAHKAAKSYDALNDRNHVRIELLDIDTSKAGIIELLRGYSVADLADAKRIVRAWGLSARGGLVEEDIGSFLADQYDYIPE